MTHFTPSPLQAQAIRDIKDWFENRAHEQPVFRVWGYAGTGKSTLTKHAIAELGLDTMTRAPDGTCPTIGGVLYGAFTGKAALVMTRKGTRIASLPSCAARTARPWAANGTSSTRGTSRITSHRERERRDHWIRKGLIEAVWGYAITCHKAQGSAWPNVIVFRRRSRPHRRGPGPLALHRDHPRRERAGVT